MNGAHAAAPVLAAVVPLAQAVHAASPVRLAKVLGAHGVHRAAPLNATAVPRSQEVQAALPLPEYVPGKQAEQKLLLAAACVPAGHVLHTVALPPADAVPAGQTLHAVALATLPGAQLYCAAAPCSSSSSGTTSRRRMVRRDAPAASHAHQLCARGGSQARPQACGGPSTLAGRQYTRLDGAASAAVAVQREKARGGARELCAAGGASRAARGGSDVAARQSRSLLSHWRIMGWRAGRRCANACERARRAAQTLRGGCTRRSACALHNTACCAQLCTLTTCGKGPYLQQANG